MDGDILDAEVLIRDGLVQEITRTVREPAESLDAGGRLVLPGLIDAHVHLRDWGESYKEDLVSGTRSAVAGGFTAVLEMPNTRPPIDSPQRLEERKAWMKGRIHCDVATYALPGRPADIPLLRRAGAVALKVYLHRPSGRDYVRRERLLELLSIAGRDGMPVAFHAEHPDYIGPLGEAYDAKGHARAHPAAAELEAVRLILGVARDIPGAKVHIAHLSTGRVVPIIRRAKKGGLMVSCEVTPHHLFLTRDALTSLGRMATVEPPLRGDSDTKALRAALAEGVVDIMASDHAPHAAHEKASAAPPPGFPGLETMLPLGLSLVQRGVLSLNTLVRGLTTNPARVFSLHGRGDLRPGCVANLTIVDLKKEWRIDASLFESKARYSPFDGWDVKGKAYATIVNGIVAYLDGEGVMGEFAGRYIQST